MSAAAALSARSSFSAVRSRSASSSWLGRAWGRVRALIDDKGENVVTAGPSTPVEVLGFDSAPDAGDQLAVVENEARARELTEHRVRKLRDVRSAAPAHARSNR